MKQVKIVSSGEHYTAVQVGKLDEIKDHSFIHPINKSKVEGKVFLKEITEATGTEISFQELPPYAELPYFHIHRKNEETYIILKGEGEFQVDEECFSVSEGSVIRISPKGIRGLRNTSDEPMIYMVVQSKKNSLEEYSTGDGERIQHKAVWK